MPLSTNTAQRRFTLPPHKGDLPPLSYDAVELYSRFTYWWEAGELQLPDGLQDSIDWGIWDSAIDQLTAAGLVEVLL